MNDEDDGNNGSSRSSNNYLTSIWNNHYVKAVYFLRVFVGVNTAVTSLIETVDLEEKVVCDCIDGDKPDSNCKDTDTIQDDWLVYFHGDTWPEELCCAQLGEGKKAWMDIISTVGLDLEEEDDDDSEAGPDGKKAMDEEQNLSSPQVDKPSSKIDQQMNQDPTEDPTEDRTEPLSPSSSLNHPGGEVMHC
ncbi:hypothetical protein SEMRO_612_G175530.1 [Seminavis robusta]|uniref:Uncharacterized protein n=1 Tax=Seminavis robusta TaxID=568900 RepID=A0A9N8HG54_9STRA|nr:hypothetical protein SEMRO_612_G175530.1 [Seminavis robusta]|eukprot:Sro612_g175530.1 n/a (190) ;mRNA; f:52761-53829